MDNHVEEQRVCAADGLAITRWICDQGVVSLTVWFDPFKQVCPVGVVYRHRRAVQFVLNQGGVVRLFRSFFHTN